MYLYFYVPAARHPLCATHPVCFDAQAQAALAVLASTARRDNDDLQGSVARLTLQLGRESEGRRTAEGEVSETHLVATLAVAAQAPLNPAT